MNINASHSDNQTNLEPNEPLREINIRKISNANSMIIERALSVESAEMFFNGSKEKEFNCDNINSLVSEFKQSAVGIYNYDDSSRNRNGPSNSLNENIKKILLNLQKSFHLNKMNQMFLIKKYDELSNKQNLIEETIEKIKKVSKSKQKKHVKYLRYIPLSKIYYYSPKKTHFYYIFMDIVVKSRKKPLAGSETKNFQFIKPKSKKKKKIDENEEVEGYEEDEGNFERNGKNKNKSKFSTANKKLPNRYKFKPEEDEILKKLILYSGGDYMNWYQIACDFNDFIASIMKDTMRDIKYKQRTPLELYARSLELSDFYNYKKWNTNEDLILKKAILYYGPKNWQQISYCLDGRNNSQCFHRWMKGINPKIKRNKWSFEEDLTLGIALKIYGNKKWSKIANHLQGRTDIQCRERFCNILDPSLEEVDWTSMEDIKLLMLYDKMKNKWSKIAKEFGNRTDNTCWRRWKYLESIRKSHGMYPNCNSSSRFNFSGNLSRNISGHDGNSESNSYMLNDNSFDPRDIVLDKDKIKGEEDYDDDHNIIQSNRKKNEINFFDPNGNFQGFNYSYSKKKNKKKNIFLVRKITPKETIETSL
jgi:hypothetical protein